MTETTQHNHQEKHSQSKVNGVISRRDALKVAGAAGAALWVSGLPAAESRSVNEKLDLALIGVQRRGGKNRAGVLGAGANIISLCDIDAKYLAQRAKDHPKASQYTDWRKCLEQKNIDGVVVSTADHHHALISVAAMKLGKHVYCEKPLGHTAEEARLVRDTFKKTKNIATQMGTQKHATNNYRRVVELVQAGAIGSVKKAHVWCGRGSKKVGKLPGMKTIPKHLNWDIWLGPAADRPFNSGYLPGNLCWNRWWDFGNGVLGDMGSHLIDLPYWALKLKNPTRIESKGPEVDEFSNPSWLITKWHHPAIKDRAALDVIWYHSDKRPVFPAGSPFAKWRQGILFEGDKGWLAADYSRHVLWPSEKYKNFKAPKQTIPNAPGQDPGHYKEWVDAAKNGGTTLCNFEYSGALIEHNLLGNAAFRSGKTLEWDAEKFKVTNTTDADKYIKKAYRKGWELPKA